MVHFVGNFAHALVRGDTFMANRTGLTVPSGNNKQKNAVILVTKNDV